jgi:hypothetical protein
VSQGRSWAALAQSVHGRPSGFLSKTGQLFVADRFKRTAVHYFSGAGLITTPHQHRDQDPLLRAWAAASRPAEAGTLIRQHVRRRPRLDPILREQLNQLVRVARTDPTIDWPSVYHDPISRARLLRPQTRPLQPTAFHNLGHEGSLPEWLPSARRPLLVASLTLLPTVPLIAVIPYAGGWLSAAFILVLAFVLVAIGNLLMVTGFQQWAPPQLLGRVTGMLMLASIGMLPVSVLLAGVVIHLVGPAAYFPLDASTVLIAAIVQLSSPTWRHFDPQRTP